MTDDVCNAAYINGLEYRNRTNSVYYDEVANTSIQSDKCRVCIESLHGAFAAASSGNHHENMDSLEERPI
jgi:hypothetical protein